MTGFFAISSIVFGNHVRTEHYGSIRKIKTEMQTNDILGDIR